MSDQLHEPSLWAGAAVVSVIAALATIFMVYVADFSPWLLALFFLVYSAFCVFMAWRNYDGPLYGEVSADA